MSRQVAVRYVEGIDPADQEKLMQAMDADGWDVVGWGAVSGSAEVHDPIDEHIVGATAVTIGFMLYFGKDRTAGFAAQLEDDAKAQAAKDVPLLSRRERRALDRTKPL